MYEELDDLGLEGLKEAFWRSSPDGPKYATAWYDEVADRIDRFGSSGRAFLREQIPLSDASRLHAIFLVLSSDDIEDVAWLRETLLNHLDHPDSSVVAAAVDALTALGDDSALERVLPLASSADEYVRGSALRYMVRVRPIERATYLMAALEDRSPIVRMTAVDEIDELGMVEALPQVARLTSDPDQRVRTAAKTATENLRDLSAG